MDRGPSFTDAERVAAEHAVMHAPPNLQATVLARDEKRAQIDLDDLDRSENSTDDPTKS